VGARDPGGIASTLKPETLTLLKVADDNLRSHLANFDACAALFRQAAHLWPAARCLEPMLLAPAPQIFPLDACDAIHSSRMPPALGLLLRELDRAENATAARRAGAAACELVAE